MIQKTPVKRENTNSFVDSMLKSAQENKEVKPQTRYEGVNPNDIENILNEIKKGKFRK